MNKGTGRDKSGSSSGRDKSLDKSGISSSARRSPINIRRIGEDMRMKIIETAFKFPEEIDNKMIGEYIRLKENIGRVDKSFRELLRSVEPTFNRVRVIKIHNMEITKEILGILSSTDEGKIESIELRNIVFDSEDTGNKFIRFLSRNSRIRRIVLENVKIDIGETLRMIRRCERIEMLEISGYELTSEEFHNFIKVLIYSTELKYLNIRMNNMDKRYESYLFTRDEENKVVIDREIYRIHIGKGGNESWSLVIQREGGGKAKEINVNIVGNDIAGYIVPAKNYRNELVRGYRI
jgi:hypothetical protein